MTNNIKKIDSLTIGRGIAALIVAIDHFCIIILNAKDGSTMYYWASFFGSFGVGLFFLISGFVISLSLFRQSAIDFLTKRVYRLYPVFIFAVFLRVLIEIKIGNFPLNIETLKIFLLNISMFGNLFIWNDQNIEPIVWTLAIEVKFYIICLLIFLIGKRKPDLIFRLFIGFLVAMALLSHFLPAADNTYISDIAVALSTLPFMLNGVFLALYFYKYIPKKDVFLGVFVTNIVLLFAPYPIYISLSKGFPSWLLAGIVFVILLLYGKNIFPNKYKFLEWLGNISYPLYAVHLSVLVFIQEYMQNSSFIIRFIVFIVIVFLLSHLMNKYIEKPFINLSRNKKVKLKSD